MMPFSEIHIGDIYSDPYYRFGLGWVWYVVAEKNKEEKMIKVQAVNPFKAPGGEIGKPFWVKSSDRMFCESWREHASPMNVDGCFSDSEAT